MKKDKRIIREGTRRNAKTGSTLGAPSRPFADQIFFSVFL